MSRRRTDERSIGGGPSAWTIHCDGCALPHRGMMGVGAVIVSPEGARHTLSRPTGRRGCSNDAEASAFIAALEEARALGARAVHLSCDSVVVIEETTGLKRTTVEPLAGLCAEARRLLSGFDAVEVRWVPRHRNTEADALARGGLGLAPRPSMARGRRT